MFRSKNISHDDANNPHAHKKMALTIYSMKCTVRIPQYINLFPDREQKTSMVFWAHSDLLVYSATW